MAQFLVEDLTFTYPGADRAALKGINLSVEAGEYLCFCGKSGCGKTTLLRQLKTVLQPFGQKSGRVFFNNIALEEIPQKEQSQFIGFVMQNPDAQIVTDKVWHELAFGLENLGVAKSVMRLRVAEMASYFGIQHWFHKDVSELSGGQKQLLNLASIMAMQPSVLILDEPTSQLDPIAAADFLNTVRKINLELGTTILITEHRLEDVFATADRVVVMDEGAITIDAQPRDVAAELFNSNSDMTLALPAPARVFHGVSLESGQPLQGPIPLTVRAGRTWLLEYAVSQNLRQRSLPESHFLEDPTAKPVIEMSDIWFRYSREGSNVLCGLDLRVPKGSFYAIMGGNGTGKSTTLKAICGICKPQRGTIKVLGKDIKAWKESSLFKGGVAMLPQDPQNLFSKNTVMDDLLEMIADQPKADQDSAIDEVASLCGITQNLNQHPFDLSGGEQQRAALAKVLLCKPEVLLLDEPTKAIDSFFKQRLGKVLQDLVKRGITVVMVSHDVEFCALYATCVSMFFDGSIVATNGPRAFFSENSFYTTAANRMSREVFTNAITDEDVISLCLS